MTGQAPYPIFIDGTTPRGTSTLEVRLVDGSVHMASIASPRDFESSYYVAVLDSSAHIAQVTAYGPGRSVLDSQAVH